ncbi:MAG: hypothetical protein KBF23_05160 [Agitococcus sp.]|jgi:hypothetical protein|nr:hypothetical protein [Moraxellaceae bacterium]MBK8326340.1 hypothetical protein [Moraxellaceae bacterium]MBP9216538.1 hypothetical protein [Agitococcus sp.]HQV80720.1 hypothetical protein [Agitococcus sp.]
MGHLSALSLEGSRQAYLAALGIPIWTVRADVPLSAQSVPLQFVAHQSDEVHIEAEPSVALKQTPKPVVTNTPITTKQAHTFDEPPIFDEPPLDVYLNDPDYQKAEEFQEFANARAALITKVIPESSVVAASPVVVSRVVDSDSTQPIHFRFAVYACGVWQLIVPRSQLLSPSEMTLLANIQRVTQTENAPPLLFAWPMVNHYAIPRHKKAAQEALVSFFTNQALSDKGYIVLTDYEDELIDLLQHSTTKPVIKQASLNTLLQQPLQKKALWLALNQ